jgi:hypothetical protein
MLKEMLSLAVAAAIPFISVADDQRIVRLDFSASPGDAQISRVAGDVYEWYLPNHQAQNISFILPKMGINPADYDEIRFDLKPEGSISMFNIKLHDFPKKGELSSWYTKFRTPLGEWTSGRINLHEDDDGVFLSKNRDRFQSLPAGTLEFQLNRRVTAVPGEPVWRKMQIRNPRLVRNIVTVDFSHSAAKTYTADGLLITEYALNVSNRSDKAQTVNIDFDSKKQLKYFSIDAPRQLTLKAREQQTINVKISIDRIKAESLPALFAESCIPEVSIPGVADSEFSPTVGMRAKVLWGVVPIFDPNFPTPAETVPFIEARTKAMPEIAKWSEKVIHDAEKILPIDWPVYVMLTGFDQHYSCDDCKSPLRPVDETKLDKHKCHKCGKIYTDEKRVLAYARRYRSARMRNILTLAQAWQLSGREEFAQKALLMLSNYAEKYEQMPRPGYRSTCGGSRLMGGNTLVTAWNLPRISEAYTLLKSYDKLEAKQREAIEHMIRSEAELTSRHSVEYSNMQAEHMRAYGTAAVAVGSWSLAAEAVCGEFGWHEMVKHAYSSDGVAHEAGAYHKATFGAMTAFAAFLYNQGINVMTPYFKRAFDGSLSYGLTSGFHITYELAYRVYHDKAYVPVIKAERQRHMTDISAFLGVPGLPEIENVPVKSEQLAGAGYIFLREGSPDNFLELKFNYIQPFDRLEFDRLQTQFFHNGRQLDGGVGRIVYTASCAKWMYQTAAHNTVVVDGQDQRDGCGELIAFNQNSAAVISQGIAAVYPDVSQLRAIAIVDGNFLVFDRMASDKEHTYDRYQYGSGKINLNRKTAAVETLPMLPKYGDFINIEVGAAGKSLDINYGGRSKMRIVSDRDMTIVKAATWKGYHPSRCEVSFARVENTKNVSYLAAFTPGQKLPGLKILKSNAELIKLEIKTDKQKYIWTIKPNEKISEIE